MTTTEHRPGAPAGASDSRADRFVRELADLKIPDPAAGRPQLWLRVGVVLMGVGVVLAVVGFVVSHNTYSVLTQNDCTTLAIGGLAVAVVGAAVFLRYSLTSYLRYWMARQSYDLSVLADRLAERTSRDGNYS